MEKCFSYIRYFPIPIFLQLSDGGNSSMVNDYFAIDITGFVMENHPFCDDKEGRQHSLLPPLGCSPAKTDGAVNGGRSPFILTGDWLG